MSKAEHKFSTRVLKAKIMIFFMFDFPTHLPIFKRELKEGIYNSLNLCFGYSQLNCEDTFFHQSKIILIAIINTIKYNQSDKIITF